MNIVFMGTPDFAVPSLQALLQAGYPVIGVFTQPDRPRGRGKKLAPSPVKEAAMQAGLPVFQPEKIRRDGVEILRSLQPDLCVTAAFGQILSQEILNIPRLGNINVHASLLPRHRGAAPVAYALLEGDETAGVTTMWMDAGIDTGDILLQCSTPVADSETCAELTGRLSLLGADLLLQTLTRLEGGTLQAQPQNEALMTYDPMLTREMGLPRFSGTGRQLACQINALNPWPCVSVPWKGERLKLLRAEPAEGEGPAGSVLLSDPRQGLVLACESGAARILELQAPGKRPMAAGDFLRGNPIPAGTLLFDPEM